MQPSNGLGHPNVLLILMDDMGFSDPGCFGGEIETPHLNKLAQNGLRFTQCYNTGRCWPTRSATLTGYYAPQIAMDPPAEGYRPSWQREIPHYLKAMGYRSYHSGKWHVNNVKDPTKDGGFDISWGYDIEQFNHFFTKTHGGKFSATAITDHALDCLRDHEANHQGTPFFHYLAYTTPHFPVQAEQADIDKYCDRYLEGWDACRQARWERLKSMGIVNCNLSAREDDLKAPWWKEEYGECYGDGEIPYAKAWESLTQTQKRFQATKMAIHAAMVDRTDREIGRVLDKLRTMGVFDNTLIFFLSDNGASAEVMIRGGGHDPAAPAGSGATHLCLGPGWSCAANSPFRRHKIWVHEGGIATPLIVHWPKGIQAQGELRHDLCHVVDFLPTIMDAAGVPKKEILQAPGAPALPGISLVPAFGKDQATTRDHVFLNHSGNRALRRGDWKVVRGSNKPGGAPSDPWALYHLATDRCEMIDLAQTEPTKLREMVTRWQELEDQYRKDSGLVGYAGPA